MRSEFGVPLARSTSALLLMRVLDLHALFAAAGIGLVLEHDNQRLGWLLLDTVPRLAAASFFLKGSVLALVERRLPEKLGKLLEGHRGRPAGEHDGLLSGHG